MEKITVVWPDKRVEEVIVWYRSDPFLAVEDTDGDFIAIEKNSNMAVSLPPIMCFKEKDDCVEWVKRISAFANAYGVGSPEFHHGLGQLWGMFLLEKMQGHLAIDLDGDTVMVGRVAVVEMQSDPNAHSAKWN